MNTHNNIESTLQHLEALFSEYAFADVDITFDCKFSDYLDPNERNPEGVEEHLALAQRGIIVSTGTERSFFNLIFSPEEKCEGIVVRDINPRVKAYVDFNTLLLRISKTREEYLVLSKSLKNPSHLTVIYEPISLRMEKGGLPRKVQDRTLLKERVEVINQIIEKGALPRKVQEYYQKHLEDFASIYFLKATQYWRRPSDTKNFTKCRYDLDNALFSKLQRYAIEGKIISTVGSIDDLAFLANRKVPISVVDTSNISEYSFIDFQGIDAFCPRIIHTQMDDYKAKYHSYQYTPLTNIDRKEFNALIEKINSCYEIKINSYSIQNMIFDRENTEHNSAIYSPTTLPLLKEFIKKNILDVPGIGSVILGIAYGDIQKMNEASLEQIQELCHKEEVIPFLDQLVSEWFILNADIYLAMSNIPGWNDAFERYFSGRSQNLPKYLNKLKDNNLFDQFIAIFGAERLTQLEEKLSNEEKAKRKNKLLESLWTH